MVLLYVYVFKWQMVYTFEIVDMNFVFISCRYSYFMQSPTFACYLSLNGFIYDT